MGIAAREPIQIVQGRLVIVARTVELDIEFFPGKRTEFRPYRRHQGGKIGIGQVIAQQGISRKPVRKTVMRRETGPELGPLGRIPFLGDPVEDIDRMVIAVDHRLDRQSGRRVVFQGVFVVKTVDHAARVVADKRPELRLIGQVVIDVPGGKPVVKLLRNLSQNLSQRPTTRRSLSVCFSVRPKP